MENKNFVKVTQVRSSAKCVKNQILSLKGLGLGKIGRSRILIDDNCVRGMIRKVFHLVLVEEVVKS